MEQEICEYQSANTNPHFLGGFLEGLQRKRNFNITPEISFQIELQNTCEFLANYLTNRDVDNIKESLDSFNYKLFKNPTLIVLCYLLYKLSKKQIVNPQSVKLIYTNPDFQPLIRENNISQYDIIRYCRYIEKFILNLIPIPS